MTPLHEDKQPNSKMGKGLEQTLLQGGHTEVPETDEKMINITNHQRNTNLKHKDISSHSCQNGYHQ